MEGKKKPEQEHSQDRPEAYKIEKGGKGDGGAENDRARQIGNGRKNSRSSLKIDQKPRNRKIVSWIVQKKEKAMAGLRIRARS